MAIFCGNRLILNQFVFGWKKCTIARMPCSFLKAHQLRSVVEETGKNVNEWTWMLLKKVTRCHRCEMIYSLARLNRPNWFDVNTLLSVKWISLEELGARMIISMVPRLKKWKPLSWSSFQQTKIFFHLNSFENDALNSQNRQNSKKNNQ